MVRPRDESHHYAFAAIYRCADRQQLVRQHLDGNAGQGRWGYGPRLPFLVISPWAKDNFVDHTLTDQSSAIAFIEQNFGLGQIGGAQTSGGSFVGATDHFAGSVLNMFDFTQKKGAVNSHKLFLDPTTVQPVKKPPKDTGGDQP